MIGYDFDGVITAGHPPEPGSVIITGRTIIEAPATLKYLKQIKVWCPVFFNHIPFKDKTDLTSAVHKARLIQMLGVDTFYEDTLAQAEIIKSMAPLCDVILVRQG